MTVNCALLNARICKVVNAAICAVPNDRTCVAESPAKAVGAMSAICCTVRLATCSVLSLAICAELKPAVLVLLLMYCGLMALWSVLEDQAQAGRAVSIITLVGAINLPIMDPEQYKIADEICILDTSKAKRELGWAPRVTYAEAMVAIARDWAERTSSETLATF